MIIDAEYRKELIRESKLKLLNMDDNYKFKFRYEKLKQYCLPKSILKNIKKYKGLGVVSGSLSLYMFGVLDRLPNDLDIVVERCDSGIKKIIISKYIEATKNSLLKAPKITLDIFSVFKIPYKYNILCSFSELYSNDNCYIPTESSHLGKIDLMIQIRGNNNKVDILHSENIKYIEKFGIKFQCPHQVLAVKLKLLHGTNRTKDAYDFDNINANLNELKLF